MAQTTYEPWRTGCLPVEPIATVSRPRLAPRMEATTVGAIDARLWVASAVTLCAAFVFVVLGSQAVPWALGIAPDPMMASPVTPFLLSIALVLLAWRRAADLGKAARAQREADRRVRELACLDEVTGLYNRRSLVDCINARNDRGLALILLDLDDFKSVNDRYGYAAGDDLLRSVAERVANVADGAVCARLGGDEFAVLLEGAYATEECALFSASELLAELSQPVTLGDGVGSLGVSIGVSQGAPGESAASLMQTADKAMYEAKRLGRNRVIAFHPEMATS
jgi:diguanylate cyclase (GGDEF)-like protein